MKMILEIVLGLLGAIVLLLVLWNAHFQWSLRRHHGMSRDAFLEYFVERGFQEQIVDTVYSNFKSGVVWRDFGVAPDDDIVTLFNLADDGIEDEFIAVLKKLGLETPYDSAWDNWNYGPVKTVEDFVRVIAWAAKNQPDKS